MRNRVSVLVGFCALVLSLSLFVPASSAFAANSADSDGDGLSNDQEAFLGTDPLRADTDGDGLQDNEEVDLLKTNPTMYDTDASDGLPSDYQVDNDKDGLSNGYEVDDNAAIGTQGNFSGEGGNPNNPDTDEDGLGDGFEATYTAACGIDISINDGDHDSVRDGDEDCDADGVNNLTEALSGTDPAAISNPSADDDHDGLTNAEEGYLGTNPKDADSDDDYYTDYEEVKAGTPTNPNNSRSTPAAQIDTDGDRLNDLFDRDDDNDGVKDTTEAANGTSPRSADTDGDGKKDGQDAYPLDGTR